jgi:acetyl esterase/lipase
MALHPQCKGFLDMLAAAGGPGLNELPLDEARKVPYQMIDLGGPEEPVAQVDTRVLPGAVQIPVRVYRPSLANDLPALIYFHGGGFVICNLDTHDRVCRGLANASGCVVVSVDYRLAPEHKFPAAAEDAYSATRYVAEHAGEFGIDPSRIAVGGDSAGGNLATVVAMMARDRGGPALKFQLLIYPVTDFTEHVTQSERDYGHGHFLDTELMDWFADQYFANETDRHLPYGSPSKASDLRGLPAAMVITGECDPLRDQGEAYAEQLRHAGVSVLVKRYDGMIHPFLSLAGIIDAGRAAISDSATAVRQVLTADTPARV